MNIRKTAYSGMFLALALIISYVESFIPFFFGVPGIKLGLPNIIIVLTLYTMGTREALVMSVARILLAGFLFGNMYSIIYSLAGGLLSLLIMTLCKNAKAADREALFSIKGVSIAGGTAHNIGQLLMAIWLVENWSIAFYTPVLLMAGASAGLVIGILAEEIRRRVFDRIY